MNVRELLGEEHWRLMQQDYEEVRKWLKAGAQPRELLPVYRAFNDFYKAVL
jgi:hypothetical protein